MSLPPSLEYLSQAILPTRLLSALMHRFTQIRHPWIRRSSVNLILRHFDVNMEEAVNPDPHSYGSFNEFFTRALKPECRPLAPPPAVLSPVDGRISQWGAIEEDCIFQAKGRQFTTEALLADPQAAENYRNGDFATIYLAPNNYHRIHMPMDAELVHARYIPGRLFSVRPSTARAIDALFARNERLALHFESEQGPFCLVMVGALFVGSMETVMHGKICPPHSHKIQDFSHHESPIALARGAELGRFNMGSTVILLLPPGMARWSDHYQAGDPLKMGQAIGQLHGGQAPR